MNVKQITEYINEGISYYEKRLDSHAIEVLNNVLNFIHTNGKGAKIEEKQPPKKVIVEETESTLVKIRAAIPTNFDLKKETYEIINSHIELPIVCPFMGGKIDIGKVTSGIGQNMIFVEGNVWKYMGELNTLSLVEDKDGGNPYYWLSHTDTPNIEVLEEEKVTK